MQITNSLEAVPVSRHIRLNCKLLRLRWAEHDRIWECLYADTAAEKFFKTRVDYVVVCSGIFSNPFIPSYPGAGDFVGQQIHAKHFHDVSVASGRRVLIVGAGKTGMDCACSLLASRAAASVTLLYRQAHWPIPKRVLGLSTRTLLFSRLGAATLPPYYTAGRLRTAAAAVTAPLRRLFWKGMEAAISSRFHAARAPPPCMSLPGDLFYGGQVLDESLEQLAGAGSLEPIRGEVNRFVRNGVILQDGSFHAADVVLYCTGYAKTYEYFDGPMRARLGLQKDGLYLYRNCLPPGVPQLAFVGSEVSTYSNIVTQGLQALWLAHVLAGRVALPPPAAMEEDVRAQQVWKRQFVPAQRNRASVLMSYQTHYHDQLLQDMRLHPRRKGANVLSECFGAYTAADYSPLLTKRDAELAAAVEQAAASAKAAQAAAAAGAAMARAQRQQRQRQQQGCDPHGPYAASGVMGRSLYPAQLRAAAAAAVAAAADGTPARQVSGDVSMDCDADDEAGSIQDSVRSVVAAALAAAAVAMEGGRQGGYGRSYRRASGTSGDGTAGGGCGGAWTAYPTAGVSFTSEAAFQLAHAGVSGQHCQQAGEDSLESVTASATAAAVEAAVAAALAATATARSPGTRRSSAATPVEHDMQNTWPFTSEEEWQESSRCEEGAGAPGCASAAQTGGPCVGVLLDVAATSGPQQRQPQRSATTTTEVAADCASPSDGASSAPTTKSQSMSLLRKLMRLRSNLSRSESANSVAGSCTPMAQQPEQQTQQQGPQQQQQQVRKLQIRIPSGRAGNDAPEVDSRHERCGLESASRSGLPATATAAVAAAAATGAVTSVVGSSASHSARMWDGPSSPRCASAATTTSGFLSAPSSRRGMSRSVEARGMGGSAAAVAAAAAAALAAATTVVNMQAAAYERGGGGGSGGGSGVASARSSTQGIGTPGSSVHGANSYRSQRQSAELVAAATATALRRLSRRTPFTTTAADEASGAAADEAQSSPRCFSQFRPSATAAAATCQSPCDEPTIRCSITYSGTLPVICSGAAASAPARGGSLGLEDVHRCSEQLASGSYSLGPGLSVERDACNDESAWAEVLSTPEAAASAEPVPAGAAEGWAQQFDCSWRQRGVSCGGANSGSLRGSKLTETAVAGAAPATGPGHLHSTPVSPPLMVVGSGRASAEAVTTTGCWHNWNGSPGTPPLTRTRSHVPRAGSGSAGGYNSNGGAAPARCTPGLSAYAALRDAEALCSGTSAGSNGLLSAVGDSGALSSAPGSITLNGGMVRLPGASVHRGPGPLSPPLPAMHQVHQHHHYSDHPQQHQQHQQQQVLLQYRHQQQHHQHKHATAMLVESLMGMGAGGGSRSAGGNAAGASGASPPPCMLLLAHRRRHSGLDPMPLATALETLSEEDASVTTATPSFCGGVVLASESQPRSTGCGAAGCERDGSAPSLSQDGGSGSSPTRGSSDCLKVGVAAVHAARLLEMRGSQPPAADSAWLHTELSTG
ncbi:hypothetical protein HXX76_011296 [Chlamydomonas incerta]|uniref:Flavin-containing monooxygenase n=1 Tax=Chlamydomonas incerta TaxID=51695 RepID=A0A835VV54_CHLIN|nr:hypothetical protein HXX76_011296 [Chlamydomonas incerta]|eukprot:KAG2429055.1 hypothetical protein HXX76_011296 [Chlamydomonas incerta]